MARLTADGMWEGTPDEHSFMHEVMEWQPDPEFITWVVYDHPADFPDNIVVRPYVIKPRALGGVKPGPVYLCEEYFQVLDLLAPLGLVRMMPKQGDDPTIVETWI